jgi:pimeloyl-ACP methyl ester carboxylesterase
MGTVPSFASYDGTQLSYRVLGTGDPLVCLPGGPGRAVKYLGNLGGLHLSRRLVMLDPRGVGESASPEDPATFSVNRLVSDVEALRAELGLEQMDLLAHSAGSVLATLYAAEYPERLSRLALITPGLAAVGIEGSAEERQAGLAARSAEPWYPVALAALEQIYAGSRSLDDFRASRPFYYGRWDETVKAHAAVGISERHQAAREGFFADAVIDPPATRAALTKLAAPVLLYVGAIDPMVTLAQAEEAAPLFGSATVVVQPGASHFPWIDDPAVFVSAISAFLGSPSPRS